MYIFSLYQHVLDEARSLSDLQHAKSPSEVESVREAISLDVYYEALCPDSK